MKHLIFFLYLIIISITASYSQISDVGIIKPGDSYTNDHDFKVYYMPESKVVKFLDMQTKTEMDSIRILKYKELTNNYQERIFTADSALALKRIEAEIWYSKLQENDRALEEQRIINIKLVDDNNKIRKSRLYYFAGGVLAASIVYIAVK